MTTSALPYSIVVVTWNCADHLAGLVASMNEHLGDDPELVVVDNASSDDPRHAADGWRGKTTYVQLGENVGFGKANNVGVRAAEHEAVVLLNPDTRLVDGSLSALALEALELRALVGPRVLNADRTIQPSASGSPIGIWPWVNAFVPGAMMPAWMKARTEPWRLERRARVAWLTGACIAAPRSTLLRLGPFDPSIELYSEDLELGLRAGRENVPSYFLPRTSRVIHLQDASSSRRYPDSGLLLAAKNRCKILSATHGARTEYLAWCAELLRLALRGAARRALRQDARRHRMALHAWRAAR